MLNKSVKKEIDKEEINTDINKNNYTARTSCRKSMVDLKYNNIFNKFSPKKEKLKINNEENINKKFNKYLSTRLSKLNISNCINNTNPNIYKNKRNSLNKLIIRKKGTKKIRKPKKNINEEEQFLQELLFKDYNKINNYKKYNDNKNKKIIKLQFNKYRNYIIKIQNNFNQDFELFYINNINNEIDDINQIKKLEDIFARYNITIFFLLKFNFEEAKTLFLLMLKENEKYIDLFEYKIYKTFSKIDRRINLIKSFPRTGLYLLKIFSSIIKFSTIFNTVRYKNKFLFRYLSLHSLNYRIFRKKCEIHGFSTETKNNIKYWFSLGLHYASYFSLYNYCSLKIPIALSELILKVYKNADQSILYSSEKTLLVNTSYNYSFIIYANNQNDQALKCLEETKQRIVSYYEENHNHFNHINSFYNNVNSTNTLKNYNFDINEISNTINHVPTKKSLFFKQRRKTHMEKERNSIFFGPGNIIEKIEKIVTTNKKNSLRMDNINSLFLVELHKNFNRFSQKTLNLLENNLDNYIKFKNEYEKKLNNNKNNMDISERNSTFNIKPLLNLKNYEIPKYMKNPLLIKIELLMCEIEIDKKNFYAAYEHIKTSIIIMFIMKNIGEVKLYENFKNEIRIMLTYLNQIESLNDKKMKKRQIKYSIISMKNKSNTGLRYSIDKLNFEPIDLNNNNNTLDKLNNTTNSINCKNNNYKSSNTSIDQDNSNDNIKGFLADEIEKFFIFLSSLSMYQIKILNDFQPKTKNKNDLPILFHSQFKDSLTSSQRVSMENLQTMTLSRYMILENPNKPILPTNLKFKILKLKRNNNINLNNFSFGKNNLSNLTIDENNTSSSFNENEPVLDIAIKTKEHEIFQQIILSKNNNIEFRKFLFNNYQLVIRILKESNTNDIEKIIENPTIIVEPIKNYLKKHKNVNKKTFSMSMNRQCFKLNDYNYLFRNSSSNQEIKNKLIKNQKIKRMKSSFYSIDDFSFNKIKANRADNYRNSISGTTTNK